VQIEDRGHMDLVYQSFRLRREEESFLRRALEPRLDRDERLARLASGLAPEERARLAAEAPLGDELRRLALLRRTDPPPIAARALLSLGTAELADLWLERARRALGGRAGAEELERSRRVLDLDDPAGRLPGPPLVEWHDRLAGGAWRIAGPEGFVVGNAFRPTPEELVALLAPFALEGRHAEDPPLELELDLDAAGVRGPRVVVQRFEHYFPVRGLWREVVDEAGIPEDQAHRAIVRLLLKASFFEERVVERADGTLGLEVCEEGRWRPLALAPAAP
jgi:hypothetical protein